MTRAYVTPFRTIKVRLESDPTEEHRFEVGRLVPCATCGHPCAAHLGGRRKCVEAGCACPSYEGFRDYDAADLAAAVGSMAEFLVRSRATVAEVEGPHTYLDSGRIVGAVLAAIEDVGIEIDAPWRKEASHAGNHPRLHDTQPALTKARAHESAGGAVTPAARGAKFKAAEGATHAPNVAATPAPLDPASPPRRGVQPPTVTAADPAPDDRSRCPAFYERACAPPEPCGLPINHDDAHVGVAGTVFVGGAKVRSVGPKHTVSQVDYSQSVAVRIAGIDPGTARIAVVIGETVAAAGGKPIFVASRVFEIGRVERIRARNRHTFTDADVDAMCPGLVMFLRAHNVARASVESSNGGMFGNAAEATRANHVGGAIYGYLRASGIAAARVTESTWYSRIVKGQRRKRNRTDPRLLAALQAGFAGTWPDTTGEDVRDAGGVLLGMVTPPSAPKRAKPKPVAVPKRPPNQRRTQTRAAKRKAAGCTCRGTSTHRLDCPARMP